MRRAEPRGEQPEVLPGGMGDDERMAGERPTTGATSVASASTSRTSGSSATICSTGASKSACSGSHAT